VYKCALLCCAGWSSCLSIEARSTTGTSRKSLSSLTQLDQSAFESVNLSLPVLQALGANWLVDMSEHFSSNPDITVHGFVNAGIAAALDGSMDEQDSIDLSTESDFEIESD